MYKYKYTNIHTRTKTDSCFHGNKNRHTVQEKELERDKGTDSDVLKGLYKSDKKTPIQGQIRKPIDRGARIKGKTCMYEHTCIHKWSVANMSKKSHVQVSTQSHATRQLQQTTRARSVVHLKRRVRRNRWTSGSIPKS